jgi:hypothetical protein
MEVLTFQVKITKRKRSVLSTVQATYLQFSTEMYFKIFLLALGT